MIHVGRKKFWSDVSASQTKDGYAILLDDRDLRTPAKAPLKVPTEAMAGLIVAEWQQLTDEIDPGRLPVTRIANAAIDKVTPQFQQVADMLSAYGATDLLCYRASDPAGLVERQQTLWQPWLDWAADELGAPLEIGVGVMHVEQPPASLQRLRTAVNTFDAFQLSAFHDLVTLSGSLVLALAVSRNMLAANEAWALSRLDEIWQSELWGTDDEAEAMAAIKAEAFLRAADVLKALEGTR